MLTIGHETLYTKTEILATVRTHITTERVSEEWQAYYAAMLAVALSESPDFIMGAIRPGQREEG